MKSSNKGRVFNPSLIHNLRRSLKPIKTVLFFSLQSPSNPTKNEGNEPHILVLRHSFKENLATSRALSSHWKHAPNEL